MQFLYIKIPLKVQDCKSGGTYVRIFYALGDFKADAPFLSLKFK